VILKRFQYHTYVNQQVKTQQNRTRQKRQTNRTDRNEWHKTTVRDSLNNSNINCATQTSYYRIWHT